MTHALEPPPSLPAAEADLAAWAAYAAALRDAGDPRGELMLLDLSIPALVAQHARRAFHASGQRLCRVRAATPAGWSLAHARTLGLWPTGGYPWPSVPRAPEQGAYANARDFVRSPVGSRIEQLSTFWPAPAGATHWNRLMRSLPATCTSLALVRSPAATPIGDLLASLPPTVRHAIVIHSRRRDHGWLALVDDRFDTVAVDTMHLRHDDLQLLADVLARTSHVRLRVNRRAGPLLDSDRVLLGAEADAATLAFADGTALALDAWSLEHRQERFGRIPIRAQLERALPEGHGVGVSLRHGGTPSSAWTSWFGGDLVRRGTAWTLRGTRVRHDFVGGPDYDIRHETAHNGRALAESEIVPVCDGDRLRFDGVECVFATAAGARAAAT